MDQLLKFVNNLNSAQRAVVIGGFSILFLFLVGLLIYSGVKAENSKLNYTIATNLTKAQVMSASDELQAAGIDFAVVGTGNDLILKTSKEFVNAAKIKLITSDTTSSERVGWEIFEKSSLGTTNFENQVKYLRALEGELSRSLESLSGVVRANVKVAIPKDSIFVEKKKEPSASAVLTLRNGIYLNKKQLEGIKNFIASAVSGLKNKNIQLIDQDGVLLETTKEEENNQRSYSQNKYKQKLEKDYENKIIELLEPFVGLNRVVAKVTLELDFTKNDIQEEIFNPEGTIRSQQIVENTSSSKGGPGAGGVAGVENNIQEPSGSGAAGNGISSSEGSNTVTNYEISKKVINRQDNNYTKIRKINAAVTFDSSSLNKIENKNEFLSSMQSVVQDTIGYDLKRGDKVSVKAFRFLISPEKEKELATDEDNDFGVAGIIENIKIILKELGSYLKYFLAAILLFVFYKKFIASDGIELASVGKNKNKNNISYSSGAEGGSYSGDESDEEYENFKKADDFNEKTARGRLKNKVKSQLLNNIDGLDEEIAAKYEVLIEELDKEVNTNPEEIAKMIEMLLSEGDLNFRKE